MVPPALGALPGPLAAAVAAALAGPHRRVQAVRAGRTTVWLKRAERLSLRWRLQKGDSRRAFEADRAGLHALHRAGLPVPAVLAEGADFLVLADGGPTLSLLLADPAVPAPARRAAFAGGGRTLAALHRAGLCHGRPSIRDICWDGAQARLIDLERFRPQRGGARAQAGDLVVFLYSILSYARAEGPELDAAAAAYRAEAPADVWPAAQARIRRLRWLAPLARGLLRLRPASRELNAVPLVIDYLTRPLPPAGPP